MVIDPYFDLRNLSKLEVLYNSILELTDICGVIFNFLGLCICLWTNWFGEDLHNDGQVKTPRSKRSNSTDIRTGFRDKASSSIPRMEI